VEWSESAKRLVPCNRFDCADPHAADELLNQSKPLSPSTMDGCEALMKSRGWSSGAVAHIRSGKALYVVTCNRGEEWIVGKGVTQHAAWKHAVKRAEFDSRRFRGKVYPLPARECC
jgi:hypothetical protein